MFHILLCIDVNTAGNTRSSRHRPNKNWLHYVLNNIAMKITRLVNSSFLISVRSIIQDFLGLFRFSEADACAILSAYGLTSFEVDRLQNNNLNEQKQTSGRWGKVIHRKRIDQPREPIPIGVHPDITWGNWTTASREHVGRTSSRTVNP